MASNHHGYEDERFKNAVNRNFHCPICMNVFKDPMMCQRNQHCFCRPCITRHLENSETCPSCMEGLTLSTLRQPPRLLSECLSELIIRCDYFSRGCAEFMQLEKLESHVKDCGFAPVVCSNEGCPVEINKRDRAHHEAEVCDLRKVKCHNCTEMTKMMADMINRLHGMEDKLIKLDEMEKDLATIKNELKTLPEKVRCGKSEQNEIMNEMQVKQQHAKKVGKVPNEAVAVKDNAESKYWRETDCSSLNALPEAVEYGESKQSMSFFHDYTLSVISKSECSGKKSKSKRK